MNDLIYYEGDIVTVKNIIFKDTNQMDTRINGHPVIVLNSIKEFGEKVYSLKMSSSYSSVEELKNYYLLKPSKANGLRKASYVDLRYVYDFECTNIPAYNQIDIKDFEYIKGKLKAIQDGMENPDNTFLEFNKLCSN